jgi:hypothetical protein
VTGAGSKGFDRVPETLVLFVFRRTRAQKMVRPLFITSPKLLAAVFPNLNLVIMSVRLFPALLILSVFCRCGVEWPPSMEYSVHPTDTACKKEIARAKADIANAELVYCHYTGNIISHSLRAEKEMDSLLKLQGIGYKNESSPCVIQENRKYHCYCQYMEEQINRRYGEKFTDSLLEIADRLFVLHNPDLVFEKGSEAGSWDRPPVFPGDSVYNEMNHSGLQKEFDRLVEYPAGYRYTTGTNSIAVLEFDLDIGRDGKAKITDSEFLFWNMDTKEEDYNTAYHDYLRSLAAGLIERATWTPAKIKSISVHSKCNINVYLK